MNTNLPATKDDLKPLATKDELNAAIAKLATKEELKDQLKQLENRIIDHLDSFLAEIRAASEERELVGYRLANHKDRITTPKTKLSIPKSL